jgi:hypothetical protein
MWTRIQLNPLTPALLLGALATVAVIEGFDGSSIAAMAVLGVWLIVNILSWGSIRAERRAMAQTLLDELDEEELDEADEVIDAEQRRQNWRSIYQRKDDPDEAELDDPSFDPSDVVSNLGMGDIDNSEPSEIFAVNVNTRLADVYDLDPNNAGLFVEATDDEGHRVESLPIDKTGPRVFLDFVPEHLLELYDGDTPIPAGTMLCHVAHFLKDVAFDAPNTYPMIAFKPEDFDSLTARRIVWCGSDGHAWWYVMIDKDDQTD